MIDPAAGGKDMTHRKNRQWQIAAWKVNWVTSMQTQEVVRSESSTRATKCDDGHTESLAAPMPELLG